MEKKKMNAEVIAVYPNRVKISVDDLCKFTKLDEQVEKLKVGSYLEIADDDNHKLIAIIESYAIEVKENAEKKFIIEANPLGIITDEKFSRGGDSLTIPPTKVLPAKQADISKIYSTSILGKEKLLFSKLAQDLEIETPINGNKFFNKHFAIVGSTGSGKSHTVAKVLQTAIKEKKNEFDGLNNSHIVLFDIHGEYKSAFPDCNFIDIDSMVLPYWLLNSEELEELFLDTEANDHNQRNIFKEAVVLGKKENYKGDDDIKEKIHYDSPLYFDIKKILEFAVDKNEEMVPGKTGPKQGSLYGKLTNFVSRLENKISDKRLEFFLGEKSKKISFRDTIEQLLGYSEKEQNKKSNITVIDLGGIPFEVLSITVSLISRILFEYGYYYKKLLDKSNKECEIPILLVYEEAHKYVPKSDLVKYRASKNAIERIAKEGRKYGVTLGIVSQRPSEISETIFSQCNNFIAMRLTNPDDQNYVKRLLPDTLGNLTEILPSLQSGEALLIGEAIIMPSIVKIDECNENKPSSNDIKYFEIWKDEWKEAIFEEIIKEWEK